MNVAIVEDQPQVIDQLKAYFTAYEGAHGCSFSISTFKNAILFLTNYRPEYDLVLMDIEMPHMDGMEAARRLRGEGQGCGPGFRHQYGSVCHTGV